MICDDLDNILSQHFIPFPNFQAHYMYINVPAGEFSSM